jgi:hypothetical protein
MSTKTSLVITSIAAPNYQLKEYAAKCLDSGFSFILIGDVSSPAKFELDGCSFFSIADQEKMQFSLAQKIPKKHYARKNLGYLEAISQRVDVIRETDDDNAPLPEFWNAPVSSPDAYCLSDQGWLNVYKHFSKENVWPRGFPLDEVLKKFPDLALANNESVYCPVQQGLANLNPDVDAVYRLVLPLPFNFDEAHPLALGKNTWCPFNSQNTSWFSDAFPLLYLPSYCSFRMTDIWRSLVVQRICWENNWHVLFHQATVYSERNDHDLMKDFADEISGYLNNRKIADELTKISLKKGKEFLGENLFLCYEKMVEMKLIDKKELELLNCWLDDLNSIALINNTRDLINQNISAY